MDFSSVFRNEIFRPIVIIITPAIFSLIPYLYAVHVAFPNLVWPSSYPFNFAVLMVIIAVGLLLEDLGSMLERLSDEQEGYDRDIWKNYLKLKTQDEIVGQRYLRTVQTRMKFELSMIWASWISMFGVVVVRIYDDKFSDIYFIISLIVLSGLIKYLWHEAQCSLVSLRELHEWIWEAINEK